MFGRKCQNTERNAASSHCHCSIIDGESIKRWHEMLQWVLQCDMLFSKTMLSWIYINYQNYIIFSFYDLILFKRLFNLHFLHRVIVCINNSIIWSIPFKSLRSDVFNAVSYVQQGCTYLMKNKVQNGNIWKYFTLFSYFYLIFYFFCYNYQFRLAVFYVNVF